MFTFGCQNYKKIFLHNNQFTKKIRLKFVTLNFNRFLLVVSPRFELGQAEPKTAVLPLHHETIIGLYF